MIGEISRLPFGSLWSWTNKPIDEEGHKAKTLCYALKRYQVFNKDLDAIKIAVDSLDSRMGSLPFSDFFSGEVALVPIPSSKPTRPDDVWVSRDICDEMEKRGLGLKLELLKRAYPIRRSSLSPPGERPSPIDHYNSMRGRKIERIPTRVILVDDVITKGHTMLGSAWRVIKLYPNADIRGFAVFRTISNTSEFVRMDDPVKGEIIYDPESRTARRIP